MTKSKDLRYYITIDQGLKAIMDKFVEDLGEGQSTATRLALRAGVKALEASTLMRKEHHNTSEWAGFDRDGLCEAITSANSGYSMLEIANFAILKANGFPPTKLRNSLLAIEKAIEQWAQGFASTPAMGFSEMR